MNLARRPFLAWSGLALLGVARSAQAAETIEGSGVAATRRRDLAGYTAIGLSGPFEVVLRPAERDGIELHGDDNVLSAVEMTIESSGGQRSLRIALRKDARVRPRTPVRIVVDFVRLDAVSVAGGGSIRCSGIRADSFSASISGSGRIDLDGRAASLDASIVGSGRIDAAKLVARGVSVSISGSGDARVQAERTLAVSIAGSGDVVHSGAAVASTSIVGSGRVRRAS